MSKNRLAPLLGAVGLSLVVISLWVTSLQTVGAGQPAFSRGQEPVVVSGSDLAEHQGVPLEQLVLYRYQSGAWQPIPFQIDEVNITGTYVFSEDGLLDSNDQLAFMAFDGGQSVAPDNWPADDEAQLSPRVAITVSDPLDAAQSTAVYLFRSTTLTRSLDNYISWDEAAQQISTLSYTAAFSPQAFLGLDYLALNGATTDLLDRQKTWANVTIFAGPLPISTTTYNEETILNVITETVTVTLPAVGPIRAVGGGSTQQFAFYSTLFESRVTLDLSDVDLGSGFFLHFNWLRTSFDWLDPTATGMAPMSYYDSNTPGGVTVDGNPDPVSASPLVGWSQSAGATGGLVNVLRTVDPGNGVATNYYVDDGTFDGDDTGDGRSYADAGLRLDDPDGPVSLDQINYIIPPATPNVGATYQARADNPLSVTTAGQVVGGGGTAQYMPIVLEP